MTSWPQIRGLSYSTAGRTARGTVYSSDGTASFVWFGPPTSWRMENSDGSPVYIENATDEYRFGEDGVAVHTAKYPNRLVAVAGVSPMVLFTAYRMWAPAELTGQPPRFGEPKHLAETEVRGRQGWEVEFDDSYGGPTVSIVLDAELGMTLSWSQGEQWVQMESPVLDEDFDPALFSWEGVTLEFEDHLQSPEQLEYEQRMQELTEMPPTRVTWVPTEVTVSPTEGDPMSGALGVTVSATSTQFGVRRWLTALGEPEVGFSMELYSPRARTPNGPWTVELRSYNEISTEEAERVLAGVVLPDPPGNIGDIRDATTARQQAADEAEIVATLGTGRNLDDYLHPRGSGGASLLVRTDFSNDQRWREVALAALKPVHSDFDDDSTFQAGLTCIDHPDNDGLTVDDLLNRIGEENPPYYAFIADTTTMSDPEMAILVVDCGRTVFDHEPGRTFRVVPAQMQSVENNLSIANMDFRDFADAVDDDGVFRGFPPSPPHVAILQRDELIALSATNQSTPALARFAEELSDLDNPSLVLYESPRATLHEFTEALDPTPNELRVGVEDYLAATSREGLCQYGHVQILGGHWNLVIDPQTGTLEAAMLRQHQPSTPS
ncbi:hypothetical protein GS4_06_00090 [Gordonia soli NBRC 108243]|uniref:DUF6924 domain-containing protein n=2 Tax=Gordonia soli TaxID=320799 RepID=M0QEY9_9ACTN|nr:hypothetical protein GS4_06_00090 [Gordonia soli NBRC 108243]